MNSNLRTTIICFILTLVLVLLSFFVFKEPSTLDYVFAALAAVELAYIIYMLATGRGKAE